MISAGGGGCSENTCFGPPRMFLAPFSLYLPGGPPCRYYLFLPHHCHLSVGRPGPADAPSFTISPQDSRCASTCPIFLRSFVFFSHSRWICPHVRWPTNRPPAPSTL